MAHELMRALKQLHANPCPHVPNPRDCKKRAAVAVIVRVRPASQARAFYSEDQFSTQKGSLDATLDKFFQQQWVQDGVPELLLIKRAARQGDRWTGQVALPGGRREDTDVDDNAACIRESMEEVGLDLTEDWFVKIGNLPERVVTTSWGKKPLMVLCPYVYLSLKFDLPPLMLQPTEVHSVHWVPIAHILSPKNRTYESADISDRASGYRGPVARVLFRSFIGYLEFSAVRLKPLESIFCNVDEETFSGVSKHVWTPQSFNDRILHSQARVGDPPHLLWGLTLGMVADMLHFVDPIATRDLWSWPTFSHVDLKFWLFTMGRPFRRERLSGAGSAPITLSKNLSEDVSLDSTTFATAPKDRSIAAQHGIAGGHLIDGYFELMNRAVKVALGARVLAIGIIIAYLQRNRHFRVS